MQNFTIMKTLLLILPLWCTSLTAEKSILLRSLSSTSNLRESRDVSGPSIPVTPKPPCPSYISCPYPPYPKPTTKTPPREESATSPTITQKPIVEYFGPDKENAPAMTAGSSASASSSISDQPVRENKPGNAQGPAISVTSKPPCPGFITCPYPPYPRPTTKAPLQEENAASSPAPIPEKPVVEYFGPDKENAPEITASSSVDAASTITDKPALGNKPGNTQGPSISATSKPPCPSYITCPYPPYPRPTTKTPSQEASITSPAPTLTPQKPIVEYFGPEKLNAPAITADSSASASSSVSDQPVRENKPGNAQGPAISVTTKPPCPGFITCPYPPYPRPTTKAPLPEESAALSPAPIPEKPIVEYFGPDKENAPEVITSSSVSALSAIPDKPVRENKPGNAQGPSIPVTPKPPCPSYIVCPYPPYPQPTTKNPLSGNRGESSASTTDKPTVVYFAPEGSTASPEDLQSVNESKLPAPTVALYTETGASVTQDNNGNSIAPTTQDGQSESKPINPISTVMVSHEHLSTEKTGEESPEPENSKPSSSTEIPDGWHFPGPSNVVSPSIDTETQTEGLVEYFGAPAVTPTRRPAISATQKPQCSFYASCPYEYPKPTTVSPLLNKAFYHSSAPSINAVVSSNKEAAPTVVQTNQPNIVPYIGGSDGSQYPSSPDPVDLGNQGVYLPIYSYVYGFDPYVQNSYYYNRRPSILLTPRPFWPSYLKNPWIYPRPFGSQYAYEQDSSASSEEETNSNISANGDDRDQTNSDVEVESD